MSIFKKIFAIFLVALITSLIFAETSQEENSDEETEKSVESEYLNDVDAEIIMSLATSDDYDNKIVALQYLQAAIDSGNMTDGVVKALDLLASEGTTTVTRTAGRLTNNYPDIRRQACLMMGSVKTEHSKNTLVSIAVADNEPMVIAAAVRSLGEIGINDNDEVVDAIAFANRRNEILKPTSSLALEVLNAYEALADSTENKKVMINSIARITVDYNYVTPVRQKAYKLLKKLSSYSDDKDSKSDDSKKSEQTDDSEEGK